MPDSEKFEHIGYVESLEQDGNKFTAKLHDGTKLGGFKTKKDGTPAKVWPLIQHSLLNETWMKWTGNLNVSGNNTYRNVTYAFPVEDVPTEHSSNGEVTKAIDAVPEAIKTEVAKHPVEALEKAHSAQRRAQEDNRNASFALAYSKDFVSAMFAADPQHDNFMQQVGVCKGLVLSVADDFKVWLDQNS